ncbi:efflux RND transporter permease subunit [Blastopirellula sp. JC732]|uniref:Efflux RND transporter permease subunit n=1 Tax=Blastopirellula sediminis TaxID=2894196 RepID=A0A9X1MMF2_9BACT|nr:efflux RND transporter permease subunit [Blastopirellula sediminis]MCC9608641.1 efflux RND transporter permease subunit [Blastopirellula sediminis]MCC9628582.1 efflux RND transporter permease subunit [Blastopirellula sediminis]
MNPGVFSVKYDRVVFVAMAFVLVGGIVAYNALGRLEDPEFTIKEALIITPYSGASAEEVALEVTNPIEIACQQLGQLERVESESVRGRSIVKAVIRDQYDRNKIPQVWDELRRKIADAQPTLPPSVRGNSVVIDDFGDVYGIFLAVSGEGFTYPELRRYSEFLRRELLLIDNVKKVELFGEQQEQVFLQISRQRLARLGVDEEQIYSLLRAQNIVADGGRIRIGSEHPSLDPEGGFRTPADMLELVIGSNQSGRQFTLGDVAEIERGYADPPRRILRFDGQPSIGIGISTIQGGNVVAMGTAVREKLAELKPEQPIGIEIGEINFQPEAVSAATGDFVFNLVKAVSIVILVLLLTMGRKTGFIIGLVLFLTIMATFLVMFMDGNLLMERISLGALIIALCMLTDNAIIVIEGIKVRIEAGEEKLEVVRDVVAQNQWPLFGATAIGVLAFAAIAWSEDSTGEYTNSLFWVILISLSLSWLSSVTATPLLGYLFFKPQADSSASAKPAYSGTVFQAYQKLLILALRNRWGVVIGAVILFIISLYGFTLIDQSFFPPATRPQFMVDVFLPSSAHIRETEAFAEEIEQYVQGQDHVTHVASFVGGGGLRFLLVYSPEPENRAFVQFLVEVDDPDEISKLVTQVQQYLDEKYPDANAVAKKFLLGPGAGGRIQARFQGPDPAKLRELGEQAKLVLQDDGGAIGVRHDWREREKVIRPSLFESQSRRNGLTRVDVANALQSSLEGRVVGVYREPGSAGTGIGAYPQESRLLPIIARPPIEERSDVAAIDSMQIWSPIAGRMIPLSQVVSGVNFEWEDPIVIRRDRFPTLTVHADPRTGLPSQLFNRVREKTESIELPPGYSLEWGGEYEDSGNARSALAEPLPYFLALMVFIVVCLFNSFRVTALIWLIMPLAIIGVTVGLLLTGQPFGFMALLGVLALSGELIKNQIVVISKIETEIAGGKSPYDAILYGGTSKMRPVSMVVLTTVLGMIPLLKDPFFGAMAVCIMFGLSFAAVLSLLVTPVAYAIMYDIHEEPAKKG